MRETCHIADLSHELGAEGGADSVHFHDDRVFWKRGSGLVHFQAEGFHSLRGGGKQRHSLPYQQLRAAVFWEYGDQVRGGLVDCRCFLCTEVIAFAFTPVPVMLREGIQ